MAPNGRLYAATVHPTTMALLLATTKELSWALVGPVHLSRPADAGHLRCRGGDVTWGGRDDADR
jgi:hypothetical protein